MKTKSTYTQLRGGSVGKSVTFEFRPIDQYGDVIDPVECESLDEAMTLSKDAIDGECVAWVIELHTAYYPARFGEEKYETLATGGDTAALKEGGWIA